MEFNNKVVIVIGRRSGHWKDHCRGIAFMKKA